MATHAAGLPALVPPAVARALPPGRALPCRPPEPAAGAAEGTGAAGPQPIENSSSRSSTTSATRQLLAAASADLSSASQLTSGTRSAVPYTHMALNMVWRMAY